jgi:hypothetical protein
MYTRVEVWYSGLTATKGNDMASYTDLVAEFDAAYPFAEGDAYAFAEWLCDEREYFGHPDQLAASGELESAWEEAQSWYRQAKGVRA